MIDIQAEVERYCTFCTIKLMIVLYRQRLKEERLRYQNVVTQQRSNQVFVDKRWRIMKR